MMAKFKERLVNILERLGLEENESIEHDMVASSIKNMRKKLNDKVKFEKKAKSAAEWYSKNVKPG
jgi:preprotein translocase subunit SecA